MIEKERVLVEYAVEWDGMIVTLPAAAPPRSPGYRAGFISNETEGRKLASQGRSSGREVRVPVHLIPRPDNDYSEWAVSVATPFGAAEQETLDDRHVGYLYEEFLEIIGHTTLHDLARYSDGEIRCSAFVDPRTGELTTFAWPHPKQLRRALRQFLEAPSTPPLATRQTLQDWLGVRPYGERLTEEDIDRLNTFSTPARPVGTIELSSHGSIGRGRARTLYIRDPVVDRHLGQISDGLLFLDDERNREAVLARLAELGVNVAQPTIAFDAGLSPEYQWIADEVPNCSTWYRREGLDFRAINPNLPNSRKTFAQWNPTTKVLYVEDLPLVGAALAHAARVGLIVSELKLPRQRWQMEREFWHSLRRDLDLRPEDFHETIVTPKVPTRLETQLPKGLIQAGNVHWVSKTGTGLVGAPLDQNFSIHESHVRSRGRRFPDHQLTGRVAHCRLCGEPGSEFAVPGCSDLLTYCFGCLDASNGSARFGTIEQAAIALRFLSDREFGGRAVLEWQLDEITLRADEPTSADEVDLRLVARFGIRRRTFPWSRVLQRAGLLDEGLRTSRGTLMVGMDDHLCLSMLEKAVDDFLFIHGVKHDREPLYPWDPVLNPNTKRRADFLLADGTLVEVWGMPNEPAYAAKMQEKELLAERMGIRVVGVEPDDLGRLSEIFSDWIGAETTIEPTWIPPKPAGKKKTSDGLGDPRGGDNWASKALRDERLERCRRAVELQSMGKTRRQIAADLSVAHETVSHLLRDGKFFAAPETNPERVERAVTAAEAKRVGQRRAEFQSSLGLSGAKAIDAWKDADVLFGSNSRGSHATPTDAPGD